MDAYVDAVLRDIRMTYELLDWEKLDRLAAEIYHYEKVAAFGCDFSETAALDLQTKLRDQRKFIVTNIDDQKQADYIRNADDKTLVIVFSDSGEYVQRPQNTDSVRAHWAFGELPREDRDDHLQPGRRKKSAGRLLLIISSLP